MQRGLPIQLLVKYFSQIGDTWQIAPDIRAMVQYRPLNLLADFSHLGMFDLVFCRNVLIYFDQATKTAVLDRIARITDRGGYLVLGAAETVVGLTDSFKPLADRRGLYVPNVAVPRPAPLLRVVAGAGDEAGCTRRSPPSRAKADAGYARTSLSSNQLHMVAQPSVR